LAHVLGACSGAGSIPAWLRDLPDGRRSDPFTPSTSSSPCTRLYPQLGFSRTRRNTTTRMERTVGGRPGRFGLDRAACCPLIRSRCQRSTVSGRTSNRTWRNASGLDRCSSAANKARSAGVNRTFLPSSWRSSTAIWWRRTKISVSLSRSLAGRRRKTANVFVTVKYANRNSTLAHHAVTTTSP
jgi:hypothetical protein